MFKNESKRNGLTKDLNLKRFSDRVFALAIFLVFIIALISFYQFNRLSKANNWVMHTYEVILTANNSINYFNFIEAKQRQYILFNDMDSLQIYYLYTKKLDSTLLQLSKLTIDNPGQQIRIRNYIKDIHERLQLFNQAIDLQKQNRYSTEQKNRIFSLGKVLSNEIVEAANEIVSQEKLLLQERNFALLNEINLINLLVTTGQILSIIFLLVAFIISRRHLHNLAKMEYTTKNLSKQLWGIIESANDMISVVDSDYRYVIFNEVYRKEFKKLFKIDVKIGESVANIFADLPEVRDKLLSTWQESLAGDTTIKTLNYPLDDVINTYEITPSLIKTDDNEVIGALHIIRNITERIKEQQALRISYEQLHLASEDLKNKNEKITLILEMSDILLITDSVEELNIIIPKYCNKILGFSSGNFYIMRASKDILEIGGKWGEPSINTEIFSPNQCWSLRLGRIHRSTLKGNDLLCGHVQAMKDKSIGYVCVPLRAQNEVFGLLYIEFDMSGKTQLSDTERLLLNAFAEVIALALSNIRLRDNLRYQSIRDPLTNLYNRRYLEEFLSRQLFLALREKVPITVLMFDLDHFKRINDVHGHDAGDMVLKEFGRLLLKFVRRSDLATRFGGEEFVVILYNADKHNGKKRAEEIREAVSHLNMKYGNQDIHVTVSIGMSSFPENSREGKALIDLADKALYTAKKAGRNQVVHYDEILVEGITT